MPTPRKLPVPVTAKKSPRTAAVPSGEPFLRFYHSRELRVRTLGVLLTVETADDATVHAADLSELVLELTNSGLHQYFLEPLKAAEANFVVQQSASLGVSGIQKLMATVVRSVLGRMDAGQLLSVCGSVRHFMK